MSLNFSKPSPFLMQMCPFNTVVSNGYEEHHCFESLRTEPNARVEDSSYFGGCFGLVVVT